MKSYEYGELGTHKSMIIDDALSMTTSKKTL